MIPHRTPFFLPLIYPSLLWRIPTAAREIYLTFDDGPVPGPTEFVLECLHETKAKATFFCIGDNVRKYSSIFHRIIENGHAIGNHTFNHLSGWRTPLLQYIDNVNRFSKVVETINVAPPSLFRPPYGRITRSQIQNLKEFNIVMWDVLSFDYDKSTSQECCLQKTIKAIRPGSIVVFHDSYKAERNMAYALPRVIAHFSALGFSFKCIPS